MRNVVTLLNSVATTWLLTLCAFVVWSVLPMAVGWQPTVITSGSMLPAIRPGDVVLVAPMDPGRLPQVGQVVLAEDPSVPTGSVLHRITEIDDAGLVTTKGDANPTADVQPRSMDRLHGVARLVVPAAGRLALLREPGRRPSSNAETIWLFSTLAAIGVFVGVRLLPE